MRHCHSLNSAKENLQSVALVEFSNRDSYRLGSAAAVAAVQDTYTRAQPTKFHSYSLNVFTGFFKTAWHWNFLKSVPLEFA
jgi:hypothetical protein